MIEVVVDNINIEANHIFIVQKEHYEKYNLEETLNRVYENCTIVQIDGVTDESCVYYITCKRVY